MKKYKLRVILFIAIFFILIGTKGYASSETDNKKLLYQDATINTDGSVTVKESLWLNGEYNGAEREIKFSDYFKYPFTGIYSNFSGDTDIYNATEINNIKVYDISQSKFSSIDDINNIEKEFKEVESASKGKYGVYTITNEYRNTKVTIYCPSKKKKVFFIEYTIKDAIVVHNDVAELYWSFLENKSDEKVLDYQLRVHLPKEDKNVMVWSHGPSSGYCNIDDYQTLSLKDTNVGAYKNETIRIMFDKTLVSDATKKSNVNGKDYIIKYENAMADPENSLEEKKRIDIENQLSDIFIGLDENPSMSSYNRAKKLLSEYTWDEEQKQNYQKQLEDCKESVNQAWKELVERWYNYIIDYNHINQGKINYLISLIDEGFDENAKSEYYKKANELQQQLDEYNIKKNQIIFSIVAIIYGILGLYCAFVLFKILFEKKRYNKENCKDAPSNDKNYIVDYLINKKVRGKTFLLTIDELISQKVILIEKNNEDENDFYLILNDNKGAKTLTENCVIKIIFELIGSNKKCSLKQLKNCRKLNSNSAKIINEFGKFERNVLKEIEYKGYFEKDNKISKIIKYTPVIVGVIGYFLGCFINNIYSSVFNYYIVITIISCLYQVILISDKRRTKIGRIEYSKWSAHKRFLNNSDSFGTKELNFYNYMDYQTIENLNYNLDSLVRRGHVEYLVSNRDSSSSSGGSSYSSGSGYGGNSSDGGTGGGGGGWSRF